MENPRPHSLLTPARAKARVTPSRRDLGRWAAGLAAVPLLGAVGSGAAQAAPVVVAARPRAVRTLTAGLCAGDLVGMSRADVTARMSLLAAAGARAIRVDLNWARVQPTPTTWDWRNVDDIVDVARSRGIAVLPVVGYTPAWARVAGGTDERAAPRDVAEFARFLGAAVARYKDRIHSWEIWNEPNTGGWRTLASVADYTRLLVASADAVRRQHLTARILVGGCAPTETVDGERVAPEDFLRGIYAHGGRDAFTHVAMHPYSFPALPGEGEAWSGWSQMLRMREITVAHGDAAKGFYVTEFGAPTGGTGATATQRNRQYALAPDHVDEAMQVTCVQAAFEQVRKTPWIHALFWYGLLDLHDRGGTSEEFFGLVRHDGSRKPAYDAWVREAVASRGLPRS